MVRAASTGSNELAATTRRGRSHDGWPAVFDVPVDASAPNAITLATRTVASASTATGHAHRGVPKATRCFAILVPVPSSLAFGVTGLLAAVAAEVAYKMANNERAKVSEEETRARYTQDQLMAMGDRSPLFKYTL